MAIRSWADDSTRAIFEGERIRSISSDLADRARRKLAMLDAASSLRDLSVIRGHRLERLSGDMADRWSIRVNRQYRICFEWRAGHAYRVALLDYH